MLTFRDTFFLLVRASIFSQMAFIHLLNLTDSKTQLFPAPDPTSLSSESTDYAPSFIYTAIISKDASTVYYKLGQGNIKPPV